MQVPRFEGTVENEYLTEETQMATDSLELARVAVLVLNARLPRQNGAQLATMVLSSSTYIQTMR